MDQKKIYLCVYGLSLDSSLHFYREGIGLISSPSCEVEPYITVHVFSCSSHPAPLTELHLWEHPVLASKYLSVLPFFDLPPLPSPPSGGQKKS